MLRQLLLALLIAAAAWLLYARTLTADFVWDARAKVLTSDFIHEPANLPDVLTGRVLTRDVLDNNRPANLLSLMVDAALWGKRPAGYHLTSITLHAANCAMLFLLLLRLLPAPGGISDGTWPAFIAALAFAAHPLNCEAVAEVSYREDLLVTASILVALFAGMAFLRRPGFWRNLALGAICTLALLFGVAAKENGVAGPVVLAAYWLLWRRDEPALPWALLLGGAFVAVGGFLTARFNLLPEHSIIFTSAPVRLDPSLFGTVLVQLRVWAMQFSQVIVPHNLCADYGPWSIRGYSVAVSAAAVALAAGAQLYGAARNRLVAFGSVIFWAGLLPVSNLVPIFRPIADRFLYLPLAGLGVLLAQGLCLAARLRTPLRAAVYGVAVLWLGAAAGMTFRREGVWHDSLALWEDTALRNPLSSAAADNLGWALLAADRPQEAAPPFRRAIELTGGTQADPMAGLALAADATGQPAAADAAFARAAALDPRYAHPADLLRALVIESDVAGKLELLARRNRKP